MKLIEFIGFLKPTMQSKKFHIYNEIDRIYLIKKKYKKLQEIYTFGSI